MNLTAKAVSGLLWTFGQQFSVQLINFVISVILARVLLPAEFGLIGMLSIFIAVGNTLMDSGLTSSLIRTANPDQKDYSTVFFVNVIGSLVIYLILFLFAGYIAAFFDQPILEPVLRVYSLSFIINAFFGVQSTRLTKAMNFKTQMIIQIPSAIGGGIVGVILAYQGYGVWSLVWMSLFQAFLSTVQHWIYSGWRPDFIFDKERFKLHLNFGYKLTLSGVLDSLYQNIYNIVIGKYFSATQLGFYTRAQSLRQLPVQNISEALNKVAYPVFASIQDDNERLKTAYKRLTKQVMFWLSPVMIILIIFAEPIILLLFTDKWLPAVPYFQLLCISGITYPLQSYNLNILKVKGRSDLFFKLEVAKKIFITIGIFIAFPFGIYGILYFQLVATVFSYYVNSFYSGNMINYNMKEQILDILPSVSLSFFVGILIWMLDSYMLHSIHMNNLVRILIGGTCYFLVYLSVSQMVNLSPLHDFKTLVLKR